MMKRVRKPASESGKSVVPQQSQFASRRFAQKAGEHEALMREPRVSFSLADIEIFPREIVQPKLRLGPVGDRYEQEAETVFLQGRFGHNALAAEQDQGKPLSNRTGMPDSLKAGIESLSGIDMSDVRVHANSDRPAGLNALAYTQGNQIYLGPGQAKHLPHEAWHAVQQKQGRVKATGQMKDGAPVNADAGLEAEADKMGEQALHLMQGDTQSQIVPIGQKKVSLATGFHSITLTLQAAWIKSDNPIATYMWDELIDGIRWYAGDNGDMWYVIENKLQMDYSKWEGKANKERFDVWQKLRWAVFPDEYPQLTDREEIPKYLFKGVGTARLNSDLNESALPIGIRFGSATLKSLVARKPTKLDEITLWFGIQETAEDYCKMQDDSILLKIDVEGHPVLKSGENYFTTKPVPWTKVEYCNRDNKWMPILKGETPTCPGDAKDFSKNDDDTDEVIDDRDELSSTAGNLSKASPHPIVEIELNPNSLWDKMREKNAEDELEEEDESDSDDEKWK